MAIYIKHKAGHKFRNIKTLLRYGFTGGYNNENFKETYFDEAYTRQQCHSARRSFEDMLELCQTYFPATTEQDLAKCLVTLWETIKVAPYFCGDIRKLVFKRFPGYSKYTGAIDEGEENKRGCGKYTLNEILELQKQ